MLARLKRSFERFKRARPGERFTARYYQRQQEGHGTLRKIGMVAAGLAVCAIGVVLLFIPGPGIVFIVVGLGLISQVSLPGARAMDRAEVWIRAALEKLKRRWQRTSTPARVLAVGGAVTLATALAAAALLIVLRM